MNAANEKGFTPLIYACDAKTVDVCLALIAHGANPHHRSANGCVPLDMAKSKGLSSVVEAIERQPPAHAGAPAAAPAAAAAGGGAAAAADPSQPPRYPPGAGLALLFYDLREARFGAESTALAAALQGLAFTVVRHEAAGLLQKLRAELAQLPLGCAYRRLLVHFAGHGGYAEGHLKGLLHTGDAELVRVEEVEDAVCCFKGSPFSAPGVPKVLVLDCCYSKTTTSIAPFPVSPHAAGNKDIAILRATDGGHYGWSSSAEGYTFSLAAVLAGPHARAWELHALHEAAVRDLQGKGSEHFKGLSPQIDLRFTREFFF